MTFTPRVLIRTLVVVLALLLVPFFLTLRDGGVEGVGWNWQVGDYVVMGLLLFAAGLGLQYVYYHFISTKRIIALTIVIMAFLAIWAELAVDAVSQLVASVWQVL